LNFVIQTIIQPRVVGVTVGLSATLSFLSLIVWATILGASGAFLAIPMSLLVKAVLIDSDPDKAWLGPLLSSEKPGKEPQEAKESAVVAPATQSDAGEPAREGDAKAPGT
jgi:AI-2 transport protein TqsA